MMHSNQLDSICDQIRFDQDQIYVLACLMMKAWPPLSSMFLGITICKIVYQPLALIHELSIETFNVFDLERFGVSEELESLIDHVRLKQPQEFAQLDIYNDFSIGHVGGIYVEDVYLYLAKVLARFVDEHILIYIESLSEADGIEREKEFDLVLELLH